MTAFNVWFFDCDGVILDSNAAKTSAFRRVGQGYGRREAEALVRYHVEHGGISRYDKFSYFFRHILGRRDAPGSELRKALGAFAAYVGEGLQSCREVAGVRQFLEGLVASGARSYVVSGTDQEELRRVLAERELDRYFQGIFGSPARKLDIVKPLLAHERESGAGPRAFFCGDSRLDFEVASACELRFIMIYGYTEWSGWRDELPHDTVCSADFRELIASEEWR